MSRRIGLRTRQSMGGAPAYAYIFVGHYYWDVNKISRIIISSFTLKDQLSIPLAAGMYIYDLLKDGNFLYVCDEAHPSNITKVNCVSWSIDSTPLSLASGENDVRSACKVGNDLYLACRLSPGTIVKVDLTTFTRTGSLPLNAGENLPNDILSDGTSLYAICGTSPCKIVKIDIATFARVGVLTLSGASLYEYSGGKSVIDGGKLYVPCGYQKYAPPAIYVSRLVKVDLATFAREDSLLLASVIYDQACCCSQVKDNFVYVSSVGVNRLYKVNLTTFAVAAYLDLSVRSSNSLHIDGDFLYCHNDASDPTGAIIEKVAFSTFTSAGTCISWVDPDAIPMSITS